MASMGWFGGVGTGPVAWVSARRSDAVDDGFAVTPCADCHPRHALRRSPSPSPCADRPPCHPIPVTPAQAGVLLGMRATSAKREAPACAGATVGGGMPGSALPPAQVAALDTPRAGSRVRQPCAGRVFLEMRATSAKREAPACAGATVGDAGPCVTALRRSPGSTPLAQVLGFVSPAQAGVFLGMRVTSAKREAPACAGSTGSRCVTRSPDPPGRTLPAAVPTGDRWRPRHPPRRRNARAGRARPAAPPRSAPAGSGRTG